MKYIYVEENEEEIELNNLIYQLEELSRENRALMKYYIDNEIGCDDCEGYVSGECEEYCSSFKEAMDKLKRIISKC